MEMAIWCAVGLLVLVLVFQLYQWVEVGSAKRDMMRAHADATRITAARHRFARGGNSNTPPEVLGLLGPKRAPDPPFSSKKRRATKKPRRG